jgi:restriction system protein
MPIWLTRAGSFGEYEQKFIQDQRVYVTWGKLKEDLSKFHDQSSLREVMTRIYNEKPKTIQNWASQVWPFAHEIKKGDLIVLPLKTQPAIYVGEVTGDYHFEKKGPSPFFHWIPVKWIGESISRANFGKDLLHSFGALVTICRIKRNNAEARIDAMRQSGWKPAPLSPSAVTGPVEPSV